MQNRIRLVLIFLYTTLLCCSCSSTPQSTSDEPDILSVLFHEKYLDAAGIKVHHSSARKGMIDDIKKVLMEDPVPLKLEDGGWFGQDYYAVTSKSSINAYYYGKVAQNRPDGFGVLTSGLVSLSDWDSLQHLIYAGEFDKGLFNGYGVKFHRPQGNESTYIVRMVADGTLEQSQEQLAIAYIESYVEQESIWKDGVAHGDFNLFDIDMLSINNAPVQENYWGKSCYPIISVTHTKNGEENGDAKLYAYGILIYDGEIKNGQYDGNGILYYLNGKKKYDGNWKNGRYDGQGTLYDESGKVIYKGKWENGDYAS